MCTWWHAGGRQRVFATLLPVPTATETSRVVRGFSVNATHNAHGKSCVWWVEYGLTTAYDEDPTPERPLPGKLAAYYRETWDGARHGWGGSASHAALVYQATEGGFVRYTDDGATGNDSNHIDGVGWVHLVSHLHIGQIGGGDGPDATADTADDLYPLHLGGNWPDIRGAEFSMKIRSTDWDPNGSRLHTWIQAFNNKYWIFEQDIGNWAFTGRNFNDDVAGATSWTTISWSLTNLTSEWTYAGQNTLDPTVNMLPERYFYGTLDDRLSACNINMFPFMAVDVDVETPDLPSGSIDFDDFTMTYRQTNLCHPSSGATLIQQPVGGTDAANLTDGWGNVACGGGEWQSVANPAVDQVFVYEFANPVAILFLKIHNSTSNPSTTYTAEVSHDNQVTWTPIVAAGVLPTTHTLGPNYMFDHQPPTSRYGAAGVVHTEHAEARGSDLINNWSVFVPLYDYPIETVTHLRVTITGGVNAGRWGLGSIEAYGEGGVFQTEDADTDVNQDIQVAAGTWHYRVMFRDEDNVVTEGDDQTVIVP